MCETSHETGDLNTDIDKRFSSGHCFRKYLFFLRWLGGTQESKQLKENYGMNDGTKVQQGL